MMTEVEVTQIAERFLGGQDLRGYVFTTLSACPTKLVKKKWHVSFQVKTPEGKLIDGPSIVEVDEVSGSAQFWYTL